MLEEHGFDEFAGVLGREEWDSNFVRGPVGRGVGGGHQLRHEVGHVDSWEEEGRFGWDSQAYFSKAALESKWAMCVYSPLETSLMLSRLLRMKCRTPTSYSIHRKTFVGERFFILFSILL